MPAHTHQPNSPSIPQSVSIIGASGALGFGLTLRLAQSGIAVTMGSRDTERAQEALARAQQLVPTGTYLAAANAEAVKANELVILSVPFRNQSETMTNIRNSLQAGQLLIDATVPLAAAVSGKATRTLGLWQGSAAQQAQEMAPEGVRVVSALHTVSAASLNDLDQRLDEDVLVAGDKKADKQRVSALIEKIDGLRCVDIGKLEMSRVSEQLTAMLIGVNARYKTHAGIKISGLVKAK